MPIYPTRLASLVTLHRETLLNPELSSTSRLLYAVLLACVNDDDVAMSQVADLVAVNDTDGLRPYLDELASVGVVEIVDHRDRETVVTVHCEPLPVGSAHPLGMTEHPETWPESSDRRALARRRATGQTGPRTSERFVAE
ncbi:hypothetical protein AB0E08_08845 [Streptomyces sp. NPDC048281]|uniref:hypothetical protein n=1 Tax=Streptomyces sp. NPDC048281 TaxID=3154715 RepID=UPI003424B36D